MIRPTLSCKGSETEWAARKKLRRLWLCIRIIFLIVGITFLVCTGLMLISLAAMHTSGIMDWIDEYRANRTLTDFQASMLARSWREAHTCLNTSTTSAS